MPRSLPVFVVLPFLLLACGSAEYTSADLETTVQPLATCETSDGSAYAGVVGRAVHLRLDVTEHETTCDCEYKTSGPLGFGEQCESEYDLGGDNPTSCTRTGNVDPAEIESVTVSQADGCTITAKKNDDDDGVIDVTATCSDAANIFVTLSANTASGYAVYEGYRVVFTQTGGCP